MVIILEIHKHHQKKKTQMIITKIKKFDEEDNINSYMISKQTANHKPDNQNLHE